MAFPTDNPYVNIERDRDGRVRSLEHIQFPYAKPLIPTITPKELAADYIHDVAPDPPPAPVPPGGPQQFYEIPSGWVTNPNMPVSNDFNAARSNELHLGEEKLSNGAGAVSYAQTFFGLPIWEAGFAVQCLANPLRVVSSHSTLHYGVVIMPPPASTGFYPKDFTDDPTKLPAVLGPKPGGEGPPTVIRAGLRIYNYVKALITDPESSTTPPSPGEEVRPPTLTIPAPDAGIPEAHRVVTEVYFSYALPDWGNLEWRAFVDVEQGSILYLRAMISLCTGMVYMTDPITATGVDIPPIQARLPQLNAARQPVDLFSFIPDDPQLLDGGFVRVVGLNPAVAAGPDVASPPCTFNYDVTTDDFGAVNAYYHLDRLLRMMQTMGFDPATHFHKYPPPLLVEYPGPRTSVAGTHPNGTSLMFSFGMLDDSVDRTHPVRRSAEVRAIQHEFCHALLWASIGDGNFGFAHSAGDGIAAILGDAGTMSPDRGLTRPWFHDVILDPDQIYRHDRLVTDGWGWRGSEYVSIHGSSSEQIHSSTLFHLYKCIGGDSKQSDPAVKLATQRFAARYAVYLIIKAIKSLGDGTITPTPSPGIFDGKLRAADIDNPSFETIPGGTVWKVIEWSFQKQGFNIDLPQYKPLDPSTDHEGPPPHVDVYIRDSTNPDGEYTNFNDVFWESTDIWNRYAPDGVATHQYPVVGVESFAYVKVRNRGINPASDIVVRGYHSRPSTGLVWPADWQPMTTDRIELPGPIAPGGELLVGPFRWTPQVRGHECLLMSVSATGDRSNIEQTPVTMGAPLLPCAIGPTPHFRVIPFDNNIAQRNVVPVPGAKGLDGLTKAFNNRHFWINNPFDYPVAMSVDVYIPDFLMQRRWAWELDPIHHPTIGLPPRGSIEVFLTLVPGGDFTPADIPEDDNRIVVRTLVDNMVVGGMTYVIDRKLAHIPPE